MTDERIRSSSNLCGNGYYSRASVGNLAKWLDEMLKNDKVRLRLWCEGASWEDLLSV